MRPDILHIGGTVYWVLQTYNPDTGLLKDADSTPTVAVRKNGASVGDSVTVTKRSATTGIYDCSYNPAGEVEGDKFTLEESATVTGTTTSSATYSQTWGLVVLAVERGTDSAYTGTPPTAVQVRQEMDTNSMGLAAIYARQGAPAGASQSADIAAIKADTGNLVTRITSTLFSGITYMSRWLGALAGKTADSGTLAEITATTAGAGYDNTTDSLQAIRDAGTGGGDATAANQELILDAIAELGPTTLAAANWTAGAITGFPTELVIGDSYIDDLNRHIKVYYRASDETPITAIGSKTFVDGGFEARLVITQDNLSSKVTGTCTWVPASGPTEGYVKVEITKDQTRRAGEGVGKMQLVFTWGDSIEVEIATQNVTWRRKL